MKIKEYTEIVEEIGNDSSGCCVVCGLNQPIWEYDFKVMNKNPNYIKTLKGYLGYKSIFKLAIIKSIYVNEEERNKGYGKQIINKLKEKAIETGAKAIICIADTLEKNEKNIIQWYENLGFERYLNNEENLPTMILYL